MHAICHPLTLYRGRRCSSRFKMLHEGYTLWLSGVVNTAHVYMSAQLYSMHSLDYKLFFTNSVIMYLYLALV